MSVKTAAIIPARFGSTRFPGKVIAPLMGKPIIQWVYEKAAASEADEVYVATDDQRVADVVASFGGRVVMTRSDHPSGTDRINEAAAGIAAEIIINVQGDEPLIPTQVINELRQMMIAHPDLPMGTVAVPKPRDEIANDPNAVKVVFGADGRALYFSRAPIPFLRQGGEDATMYHHWGIYAYRRAALARFVSLPESALEQCERLEQLRALENGIAIQVLVSNLSSIGVDTPEDLRRAEDHLIRSGYPAGN
jgi:3-deoxy-manno-octulosonate cytidylyltransferase (CMP-KDO synthetase)